MASDSASVKPPASGWRPILDGVIQEQAIEVSKEIAESLLAVSGRGPNALTRPFLADGDAGIGLCLLVCANGLGEERYRAAADAYLNRALDTIDALPSRPHLFTGFVGVALALLESRDGVDVPSYATESIPHTADTGDDGLQEIDEVLLAHVRAPEVPHVPDLIQGIVGAGVYAMARLPSRTARQLLISIVDRLERDCVHGATGITWNYDQDAAPPGAMEYLDASSYPIGVAHGHAGAIALLSRIHRAGIESERVAVLLREAVEFLLAARHTDISEGTFPEIVGKDTEPECCNASWCWGDAGTSTALFAAGRTLRQVQWQQIALDAALRAARYGVTSSDPVDASLCHGAAGLGHILNRYFQVTGLPEFVECSRAWFRRVLTLRHAGEGIDGFLFRGAKRDDDGKPILEPSAGFLMGSAGVAAALVSAATSRTPRWDGAMMVDIS